MKTKYSKEVIEKLVIENTSIAGVIKALGLNPTGGNYTHFQKLIKHYELSTEHFCGQGWAKGQTSETNESIKKVRDKNALTEAEILSANAPASVNRKHLLPLMLKYGFEYKCSIMGCSVEGIWLGKEITLHIDHINGSNNDNRLDNLRFLCPNCHQQTLTWGRGKNGAVGGT